MNFQKNSKHYKMNYTVISKLSVISEKTSKVISELIRESGETTSC